MCEGELYFPGGIIPGKTSWRHTLPHSKWVPCMYHIQNWRERLTRQRATEIERDPNELERWADKNIKTFSKDKCRVLHVIGEQPQAPGCAGCHLVLVDTK